MSRPIGRFLACAGLLLIAVTTLVPIPQQEMASHVTPGWCIVCGEHGGQDVVNNVLLFVPFALGLCLAGLPSRAVIATGGLVSLGIELLQWNVVPGRDASLSDVLTNTIGSLVGATLASHGVQLLRPTRTTVVRLASCWGALWLTVQMGSALLLQPWGPADQLRGFWARRVLGRSPFEGQVVSANLSGAPIPTDSQPLTPEMERQIRAGRFDLQLRLRSGRSGKWSSVVEVLGPRGSVAAIEANGGDLAFQPPMRSALFRMGRPALRIPGALSSLPGSELTLVARDRGSTLEAEWTSSSRPTQRAWQALGPSLGWSLLAPFRYTYGWDTSIITMLWLAAWLLPLGYWTPHVSGRPFISWGAVLLLVALGVGLIPVLTGYSPAKFSEWLGVLLGLVAGAAGSWGMTYFEARCGSR